MVRSFAILCLALFVPDAVADVLIVKQRNKVQILGLPREVDEMEVTLDTWEIVADQSSGVIVREGYDGVEFSKRKGAKPQFYAQEDVVKLRYTSEPDTLIEGYELMDAGNYTRAISAFREVLEDEKARAPFREQANYFIGACYIAQGKNKSAAAHYANWPAGRNSTYTPQVHRILAEILTASKKYDPARAEYKKIESLEGITDNWKFQAQLGSVKVAIAERKYSDAERTAKRIANQTSGKPALADALALAYVLQAEAILEGGEKDRLPEAVGVLQRGAGLDGVSVSNKAYLYLTLGHALYAQGNLEQARFPYLRVACLWPGERGYAASALQNAGTVFMDLSERARNNNEPEKADELFMKAMKLLRECAGGYRGSGPAKKAGSTYMANKKRYEDLLAKAGDGDKDESSKGEAGK